MQCIMCIYSRLVKHLYIRFHIGTSISSTHKFTMQLRPGWPPGVAACTSATQKMRGWPGPNAALAAATHNFHFFFLFLFFYSFKYPIISYINIPFSIHFSRQNITLHFSILTISIKIQLFKGLKLELTELGLK